MLRDTTFTTPLPNPEQSQAMRNDTPCAPTRNVHAHLVRQSRGRTESLRAPVLSLAIRCDTPCASTRDVHARLVLHSRGRTESLRAPVLSLAIRCDMPCASTRDVHAHLALRCRGYAASSRGATAWSRAKRCDMFVRIYQRCARSPRASQPRTHCEPTSSSVVASEELRHDVRI